MVVINQTDCFHSSFHHSLIADSSYLSNWWYLFNWS